MFSGAGTFDGQDANSSYPLRTTPEGLVKDGQQGGEGEAAVDQILADTIRYAFSHMFSFFTICVSACPTFTKQFLMNLLSMGARFRSLTEPNFGTKLIHHSKFWGFKAKKPAEILLKLPES